MALSPFLRVPHIIGEESSCSVPLRLHITAKMIVHNSLWSPISCVPLVEGVFAWRQSDAEHSVLITEQEWNLDSSPGSPTRRNGYVCEWYLCGPGDKDDDDDDDAEDKMQTSGIANGEHIRQESQEQSEVDHGDFEMVVSVKRLFPHFKSH